MKKIFSLLCALAMTLPMFAGVVVFTPADFEGQGASGTGDVLSVTKSGVTFTCDHGFGTSNTIRCYKNGVVTISSETTILQLDFIFDGTYTGGLETTITVNDMSWTHTLSSSVARITKLTVTVEGEGDINAWIPDTIGVSEARALIEAGDTHDHFVKGVVATIPSDPQRYGNTIFWLIDIENETDSIQGYKIAGMNNAPFADQAAIPFSKNDTVLLYASALTLYNNIYEINVGFLAQILRPTPDLCIIASGTCGAESDNLTWTLTCDSVLTISGTGAMTDWLSYSNVPWYNYRSYIAYVLLPNGLTNIGNKAFYKCSGLTSIELPNSIISVGDYAFSDCSSLTSVTIPNSVTSIGSWAFYSCTGLTSVVWNVKNSADFSKIVNFADVTINAPFYSCTNITSFTFGDEVEHIPAYLCYGMKNLTSIEIPNSVTSIGEYAFSGCSGSSSLTIPNSVTSIGNGAFEGCTHVSSVTIPNSVTSIGNYVFSECKGMTSVTIPNSVTSIGNNAFYKCSGLASITIPNSITNIGNSAFSNCSGLTSVTIPNSVTSISSSAFSGCSSLTSVTISNSVTSIGRWAFENCSGLTSIEIPNSVTSIGISAFSGCSSLTSVTIPNSVTSISSSAFYNCTSMTSVTIPEGITSIGYRAFSNCSGLTSIEIPNSVTSIGGRAFYGCEGLTSITNYTLAPQTVDTTTFVSVNLSSCTLYVPAESLAAYQSADVWQDFGTILPIEGTEGINYTTLADIYNMAADSAFTLGAFDVVYVPSFQNGSNMYIKDSTGSCVIYKVNYGLQTGDHVEAGLQGKVSIYHGLHEITPISTKEELTIISGEAPTPMEATEAPSLANVNQYIVYKGVSFSTDTAFVEGRRHLVYGTWNGQEIAFYNQYYIDATLQAGKTYNITAVNSVYGTILQVYPLAVEEVESDTASMRPNYASSVPEQCPDVMLQAFYYDSYGTDAPGNVSIATGKKLGTTKWSDLLAKSEDIGLYFDMVWLPPSGKSDGGTGYHQTQYSNQNSAWGSKVELVEFINRMHKADTKVIADIVINHAGCKSSWCDFYTQYFSPYGTFKPQASWICSTDEVNFQTEDMNCNGAATGVDDGGYNMQDNYASARDWAHNNGQVQAMMKAYLRYMKNVIGYDGWRYDYAQGFKGRYIDMYNSASKNYFSVCEFWNGDYNNVKSYLADCNWNTTVFDFSNKYAAIQGIADGDYGKCVNSGLSGNGDGRYAVTFVDSHDTYFGCKGGRDNQDEIAGCGNSMKDENKDRVLAANAYILARPGIPCVFWPHWVKYQDEISKMVMARQLTGVHSESVISEESAGNGFYKATITGTKGAIRILLGPNSGYGSTPDGYALAYRGGNFAMFYRTNGTGVEVPRLTMTPSQKFKTASFSVEMKAAALTGTPTIYYTTDGTDPTTASTVYSGAITITETTTVKAIAVLNGQTSPVMESTYTYKAPQTTPIIVGFSADDSWEGDVYLFAWDGGNLGGWPGTKLEVGVDGMYSYQFPATVNATKFIFNNGGLGMLTAELETDCDVCYLWKNGCEELDEECTNANVKFGIKVSPGTSTFSNNIVGLDVTITAIAAPEGTTPIFYYTLDGTTPTTSSLSTTTNPLVLNFKQTTELRVMAVAGNKQTEVITAVYTYKAPQQTPFVVKFQKPASWTNVYAWAWNTEAGSITYTGGQWPGQILNDADGDGWYVYTFPEVLPSAWIIFNDGTSQTQDILVDEDACYVWDDAAKKAVLSYDCPSNADECIIASGTCGADGDNLTWKLSCDSVLTISGTGAMADYEWNESPFYSNLSISSVVIEDGVTSIGNYIFNHCSNMKKVTIPNSVTSIRFGAFESCTGLISIEIPNGVTSIGEISFLNCTSLSSVTIGNYVTRIDNWAFEIQSSNLTSFTSYCITPPMIDIIAFVGPYLSACTLYVPAESVEVYKVTEKWNSFGNILPIEGTTLDSCVIASGICGAEGDNLTWTLTCDSVLTISGTGAMADYGGKLSPSYSNLSISSVVIEEGVTSIGNYAFSGCLGLTSVTIPNSVTSIGGWAFDYCSGLTSIDVAADNTNYSSIEGVLLNKDQTLLIQYPIGKQGAYSIPNTVTRILDYAFNNCIGLTSIEIPNSVIKIERDAFDYCSGLISFDVAADNTNYSSIEGVLLNKDQTLLIQYPEGKQGAYTIPNSVTSIGISAFSWCTGLTSVTIPNSVTDIRWGAFSGCSSLTSVTIPNSVTSIGSWAFSNCSGLTSVTIGNSVTSIGDNAFYLCTGLISVTIPNSVTSIGESAFDYCFGLTSVTNNAATPQAITEDVFEGINLSTCILYVPAESLAAYQTADVWKDFGTIQAIEVVPTTYTLTLLVNDSEMGTVSGAGQYEAGKKALIQATPADPYYQFTKWSDGVTQNPRRVTMTGDSTITAYFIDMLSETVEYTGTDVSVEAQTEAVTFTWPVSEFAITYTLTISKAGVVYCTLTFDANGHLINIAFAPARNSGRYMPAATLSVAGFQFTVTGLEAGANYTYTIEVENADAEVMHTYQGSFATQSEISTDLMDAVVNDNLPNKLIHNGHIFILRGDKTYTLQGQEVR